MNVKHTDHPFGIKGGFTLVEVSASVTILVIAFGLAFGGFMYALKRSTEGDVQNELDIDVQRSMERLKFDLRLSSLDKIYYHPTGPGPYQAISFPLARDDDGDGLVELDAMGKIIWDKTLVYHIWPSSPHQLRVTTFDPRDNTLSDAERQAQLEAVVASGDGTGTYNGQHSSYDVIFENLLEWEIVPRQSQIDTYSSSLKREKESLGFVLLSAGPHDLTFTVKGKNSASSGYNIGIDQLIASASYNEREAEAQTIVTQSGAALANTYMDSGSWKGNYQLLFPATDVGQYFTLQMENDQWEETNFRGLGYAADNVTVEFDETLSPMDYVVQLDGMDETWSAATQTGTNGQDTVAGTLGNSVVRIMLKGSELEANGNWLSYNGRQCRLTFEASSANGLLIQSVYIGECVASNSVSSNLVTTTIGPQLQPVRFSGSLTAVIPFGGTKTSDWVPFEIDIEKNYLVTYRISAAPFVDTPKAWYDARAVSDGFPLTTWIMTNAPSGTATANNWASPEESRLLLGLKSVEVSYPEQGTYTSQIFDTHLDAPVYGDIRWNANFPSGTAVSIKERSGNALTDFSSSNSWSSITPKTSSPQLATTSYKRYIQFQATLESDSAGLYSPQLKDITIEWTGEQTLVEIGGTFTKGPDYGIFELEVDGNPLRSGLMIDLEIFKDIYTFNRGTKRVTSALRSEIIPRNTGK